MLGTFFSHEYLCLKLILSLSSCTLPFFLWMFMGLSPLSPSSLGIDLMLNKMWVVILLIILSPACLVWINYFVLCFSASITSCRKAFCFSFLICSCIVKCNMQNGIPEMSYWNSSYSVWILWLAAVWCPNKWLQRRMLKAPKLPATSTKVGRCDILMNGELLKTGECLSIFPFLPLWYTKQDSFSLPFILAGTPF